MHRTEEALIRNLAQRDASPYVRKQAVPPPPPPKKEEGEDEYLYHLRNLDDKYKREKKVYYITNDSFRKGTLRIQQPGLYLVREDIILEPNPTDDCQPTPDQNKLFPSTPGPYILGFFAGITIETDNVILDLQGHTIKQSVRFYMLQRFFATVELASTPFIPKQGPANFGPDPVYPKGIVIRNGTFGLTSHHAIHGNGAQNVLLDRLTIRDFEVGGISVNGIKRATLRNVRVLDSIGTKLFIPVNGRFSTLVFISRILTKIIRAGLPDYSIPIGSCKYAISKAFQQTTTTIDTIVDTVVRTGLHRIPRFSKEIFSIFGNPQGIPDCSAIYGIVFNKLGIAVNEFGACDKDCTTGTFSSDIRIENCSVSNLVVRPMEFVGFQSTTKADAFQKDFSGSLIMACGPDWFVDDNGRYDPDRKFVQPNGSYDWLLATQVLLAKYNESGKGPKWCKGVADISPEITKWVSKGCAALSCYNLVTVRNADVMGHVMKGAIGIRLDFVRKASISNVQISNLVNVSPLGVASGVLEGYLDGTMGKSVIKRYPHLGNPKSDDTEIGYTGGIVRGISMAECADVTNTAVMIQGLRSNVGSVYGLDIMHGNTRCRADNVHITSLSSGFQGGSSVPYQLCFRLPNWIPRSIGMIVRFNNTAISSERVDVSNLSSVGVANAITYQADVTGYSGNLTSQAGQRKGTYIVTSSGIRDNITHS